MKGACCAWWAGATRLAAGPGGQRPAARATPWGKPGRSLAIAAVAASAEDRGDRPRASPRPRDRGAGADARTLSVVRHAERLAMPAAKAAEAMEQSSSVLLSSDSKQLKLLRTFPLAAVVGQQLIKQARRGPGVVTITSLCFHSFFPARSSCLPAGAAPGRVRHEPGRRGDCGEAWHGQVHHGQGHPRPAAAH